MIKFHDGVIGDLTLSFAYSLEVKVTLEKGLEGDEEMKVEDKKTVREADVTSDTNTWRRLLFFQIIILTLKLY